VLLRGETGTGKDLAARAIHEASPRAQGAFVVVDSGAIPESLFESELFGHARGAFTGADRVRDGAFLAADGGTLFLDEIGELPLSMQPKLLRAIESRSVRRVGETSYRAVDVRIVAATHRDLRAMAERGEFREDLWYRLSVFPLRLPSLRERREDIPLLASHFAARIGERLGGTPLVPSSADLSLLMAYDWPGNVRELAAVIERAAILGHAKRLDLGNALGAVEPTARLPSPPSAATPTETDAFPTLDEAMRRHIERALEHTRGRIEGPRGAAAILGINPHTLRSRMRKLGVVWDRFRA
jgi:transcriptional regulator with GAF, ATPase, and Fis domain